MNLYFIDDGYTCDACIAEVDGIHGELVFSYRPMTHDEREQIAQRLSELPKGQTSTRVLAEAIAHHVVKWNIPLDLTGEKVARLLPALFDKIYAVIAGMRKSDPLPGGKTPGEFDEAKDLGNSSKG